MKQYYYIVIVLLLGALGWSINFHNEYQEPPIDKAVFATPTEASKPQPAIEEEKPLTFESSVWDGNLFSNKRGTVETGEEGEDTSEKRNTTMELTGIFRFGDTNGAVILVKGSTRIRRRSIKGKAVKQARPSKYYATGEKLSNGYVLTEVRTDSVLLVRGSEEIELKIEFGDKASLSRNKAETDQSQKLADTKNASATIEKKKPKKEVEKPKLPEEEEKQTEAAKKRLNSFRDRLKQLRDRRYNKPR